MRPISVNDKIASIESALFILANLGGIILVLAFMDGIHNNIVSEGRDGPDFTNLQNFGDTCIPMLLFFLITNSVLGVRALWAIFKKSSYIKAIAFVIILGLWLAAIEYSRCVG